MGAEDSAIDFKELGGWGGVELRPLQQQKVMLELWQIIQ